MSRELEKLNIDYDLVAPKVATVPEHVAIIMDGNGRWAKQRGLDRTEGHKVGEKVLMEIVWAALKVGVKELSLYTFSTENWNRSPNEVRFLMGFSRDIIHQRCDLLNEWGVKIKWVGRKPKLWTSVYNELMKGEKLTKNNSKLTLNMCINYGGQLEIIDAVNKAIESGEKQVNLKSFRKYLYNPKMKDVDLLIRTSGEERISNFLLYEIAYAELVFVKTLWPDFKTGEFYDCLEEYSKRNRTYGKN